VGTTAKHHLAGFALACALLGLDGNDLLAGKDTTPAAPRDRVFLGALFESLVESLVALTIRIFAGSAGATVGHPRRRDGDHEVDFAVAQRPRPPTPARRAPLPWRTWHGAGLTSLGCCR
jgi:hypothetical protein